MTDLSADPRVRAILEAADRIIRIARINEPLGLPDETPLARVVPGVWPTLGDVRRLHEAAVALGWNNQDFQGRR
jgi:hypothetical protein